MARDSSPSKFGCKPVPRKALASLGLCCSARTDRCKIGTLRGKTAPATHQQALGCPGNGSRPPSLQERQGNPDAHAHGCLQGQAVIEMASTRPAQGRHEAQSKEVQQGSL